MTLPINSVFVLDKNKGYEDIPLSPNPFFVLAEEGPFLRKVSALGVGTIKVDKMPKSLGTMGNPKGWYDFKATPIPAEICAQIVSFFRRIWDKHQTEAEVLLTARIEVEEGYPIIKAWRVFIPTQKVSMGGVDSVYDPSHIAKGHQVVGTMHSHCNFGAYHSGTDTGDAKGMDGLHLTIGHVDKEKPQVVSMVSMNGINVDFDPQVVADFSNLEAATAPAWWDNYVLPSKDVANKDKIVGFDNFSKFERKPVQSSYVGGSGYDYGSHYNYSDRGYSGHGFGFGPSRPRQQELPAVGTKTLKEINEENKQVALLPADTRTLKPKETDDVAAHRLTTEYWEDDIDSVLRDILFDNQLLTDEDIDGLMLNVDNLNTYLRALLVSKLIAARKALALMGVDVEVKVLKRQKFAKKKKGVLNGRRN